MSSIDAFNYLNKSGCTTADGINDSSEFSENKVCEIENNNEIVTWILIHFKTNLTIIARYENCWIEWRCSKSSKYFGKTNKTENNVLKCFISCFQFWLEFCIWEMFHSMEEINVLQIQLLSHGLLLFSEFSKQIIYYCYFFQIFNFVFIQKTKRSNVGWSLDTQIYLIRKCKTNPLQRSSKCWTSFLCKVNFLYLNFVNIQLFLKKQNSISPDKNF